MPRGAFFGDRRYRLHYITEDWMHLMRNTKKQRKIDFTEEIQPVLQKEIQFAYYSTLLGSRDEAEIRQYLDGIPEELRFSMEELLYPKLPKARTLQQSYIKLLEGWIVEANKGELQSPLMAAAAVWREAVPYIAQLYANAGFTGHSHELLDTVLLSAFSRTSFGPPVSNMQKILALAKAGIIQFTFRRQTSLSLNRDRNGFTLRSGRKKLSIDAFVDARIAKPSLLPKNEPLYDQLWDEGLIMLWENEDYAPGCPAMNETGKNTAVRDIPIYFYGSNTEGFLLDNDTLSREKNNLARSWTAATLHQITMHKTT